MLDILQFIFSGIWVFLGVFLLSIILFMIPCLFLIAGMYKVIEGHLHDIRKNKEK